MRSVSDPSLLEDISLVVDNESGLLFLKVICVATELGLLAPLLHALLLLESELLLPVLAMLFVLSVIGPLRRDKTSCMSSIKSSPCGEGVLKVSEDGGDPRPVPCSISSYFRGPWFPSSLKWLCEALLYETLALYPALSTMVFGRILTGNVGEEGADRGLGGEPLTQVALS